MGMVNLETSFDTTPRLLRDQVAADLFTASGQTRSYTGTISSSAKPVRITVAWTDAPGSTSGNAYKNNLDLTVAVNGTTYKGNVFSKGTSIAGGTADARNNVESVFLPAGTTGSVLITVAATNINSDGVPNNSNSLDQDFALVAYNITEAQSAAVVSAGSTLVTEGNSPANNAIDPNETVTVGFTLKNVGTLDALNVTATLTAVNGVTPGSIAVQNYGALTAGGAAVTRSFTFSVTGTLGATFDAVFSLKDGTTDLGTVSYTLLLGPPPVTPVLISQVYGGGGNSGASYNQDYIELYNRTATSQSLTGWSVQYASAAGTTWAPTTLSGSIGAGKYYLVAMSTTGTSGSALPTPDATGTTPMSATAGKVALVNSTTALSGANPSGTSGLQDLVGYGSTASGYEGSGPTLAPSASSAVLRAASGATDTDNNSADFTTGTPNPRNGGSVPVAPVITSTNAVSGFVGVSLTYLITASNGPTSFGASNLPSGLAVNTTNGLIFGAPTTVATNVAKVFASNSSGTGTSNVTFTIATPQIPVITSSGTANGTVGTTFNYTITASNSPSSFGASNLPAGLSVNTQSGVITGTPTVAGTNTAIIYAGNSAGTVSNNLVIGIAPASGGGTVTYLTENFASCTNGNSTNTASTDQSTLWGGDSNFPTVSKTYQAGGAVKLGSSSAIGSITSKSLDLSANGGTYTIAFLVKGWSTNEGPVVIVANGVSNSVPYTALISNTFEPKNLSLSGGTTSTVITFQTARTKGRYFLDEVVISSTAQTAAPTTITSATNVSGQVGSNLSYTITANNSPSSFGASTNLPTGLSLNSSSGIISGTPSVVGTNVVTVIASNSFGGTSTNVTFAISPLLPPVITSTNSTNGTVGQVFSYQITASNSPTWFNASNLPTGLNVNTNSGLISGIPIAPGSNNVTLYVSNAAGLGTNTLALTINAQSASLIAGWDFQTTTTGGTAISTNASGSVPLVYVANFGFGTIYLNGTNGASSWSNTTNNLQVTTFSGTTNNAGSGFSTNTNYPACLALVNSNANSNKVVFQLSMTGKKDLIISYATRGTASGFTSHIWDYSSNASNWTTFDTITGRNDTNFTTVTLSNVTNLNNSSNAYLRLTVLGATGALGNNRLDNIQMNAASLVTPVISTNGTLGSVSTTYGTASPTPASFRVSGENLAEGILVSAPNGYEVSATGTTATDYASSVTVGAAGPVAWTTVFVRLAANTVPGTYSGNVVCSSLAASSVNVATASSTVDKKSISISGITAVPKTYDGTRDAVLVGSPGLVGLEAQDAANVRLESPLVNFVTSDAGPDIEVVATYSLTGSAAGYYDLAQPVGLMAEIQPKAATIRANDRTKVAGQVLVLGPRQTEFSVSDLISGERIASVTLTGNGGTTADAPVGTYLITPSDPVAPITIPANTFRPPNYAFTYIDGNLTVTANTVTTPTFEKWAGQGVTMTNELLLKYAIGGAASPSATGELPVVGRDGSILTLTAIVRKDASLTVVGQAVANLGDYGSSTSIALVAGTSEGVSQIGVPTDCERRIFKSTLTGNRSFLRISVQKQ
jgi:hypothetical protein